MIRKILTPVMVLLVILLLTNGAFAAILCNQCHGTDGPVDYRPLDAATRDASSGAFKGNHRNHMSNGANQTTCSACHGSGTSSYTSGHRNGTINIAANINNSPKAGGGTYSNGTSFAQTATPTLGTCANVNCHFEASTPTWGSAAFASPADCSKCHGFAPNTGNHPVSGGKHATYYGTDKNSCVKCHPDHTLEGKPFAHATSAGKRNLALSFAVAPNSGSGTYSGALNDYLPSQSNSYGTCTNLYCHSPGNKESGYDAPNTAATWGGSLPGNCTGCHRSDFASGSSITTGSHSGHVNKFGAGYSTIACVKCHAATASSAMTVTNTGNHVNKLVTIAFHNTSSASAGRYNGTLATPASPMTKAPNSGYKTCTNVYCHSTGQGAGGTWPPTYTAPVWGTGSTGDCGTCHGNQFNHVFGSTSPLTSGSHTKHLSYQLGVNYRDYERCVACHAYTTAGFDPDNCNAALCHAPAFQKHANYEINVGMPSYFGASASYSGTTRPGDGYGSCSNVYCHSDAQATPTYAPAIAWGAASPGCAGCHKGNNAAALKMSSNKHGQHINNPAAVGRYIGCAECHAASVSNDTTISSTVNHVDKNVNIKFDNVYNLNSDSPTYDGATTTGAAGRTKAAGSALGAGCANVYCHSNGNTNGGATPTFKTVTWNGAAIGCDGCHGGSGKAHPTYATGAAGSITANSHVKHVETSGYGCDYCHISTTTDATIPPTTVLNGGAHLNRTETVAMKTVGGQTGSYVSGSKTCTTTYCHGGGNPIWGANNTLNCASCHQSQGGGGSATYSGKHQTHVDTAGYDFSCESCHAVGGSVHSGGPASGTNPGGGAISANQTVNISFASSAGSGAYRGSASSYIYRNLATNPYNSTAVTPTYASGGVLGGTDTANSGVKYTNGTCNNVWCHSNAVPYGGTNSYKSVAWNATLDCGSCHNKGGDASPTWSAPHTKHINTYSANSNMTCNACHANTASNNTTIGTKANHANGTKTIAWNAFSNSAAPAYNLGTHQCQNTYCHSTGTSVSVGTPSHAAITWTGTLSNCNGCHGGANTNGLPDYTNGSPKANSHARHSGYTCNLCHNSTTSNGTSITTVANHVNKAYNVNQGGTVVFTYTYSAGGGSCSTISCHGGNSATWGGTLTCQGCHLSTADADNYVYNDGTIATVKNAGEWDTTGHGKASGSYASGNSAAAFTTTNACEYCHDKSVSHGNGSNVFRLKNMADATWGKNGVCMSCHASGSAGVTVDAVLKNGAKKVSAYHAGPKHDVTKNGGQFCWDCHDPHGDTNRYMVQVLVAKTSNSTTTVPTSTAAVTFTASSTGTDYAGAATKVCNACHSVTTHYTGATGNDGHNSGTRCTTCHSHSNTTITKAFYAGESAGGSACGACHNDLYNSDQSKYGMHSNVASISYRHYMDNDSAGYSNLLPNGPSTNVTSRKCTMCHVDHDKFKVAASSTSGRAFNIRPYPQSTPTAGSNTDLTMCTACHYQVSDKFLPSPNGETTSMPIPFPGLTFQNATTLVKNSTHGYVVASQEFADSTLGNTSFNANCTKCHNDSIGKNAGAKSSMDTQDGTVPGRYKFGNHVSTVNNFYSVLSSDFFQGTASSATNTTNATITVTGAGWSTDQWAGFYVVTTDGTGQNQRKVITGNTATVLTLSGTFTTALDNTTKFDIVQSPVSTDNICFACHSKNGQGKSNGANLDWYGQQPMKSALEGIQDLFIGETGVATGGSTTTLVDSTKSWTVNAWTNYTVRFLNGSLKGQVRKIASNTNNTLTIVSSKRLRTSVTAGTEYEIFKPAYHPIDSYGRHNSSERVAPVQGWNTGDTGNDSNLAAPASVTSITDIDKYWSTNQWSGMTINFPARGLSSTISSNTNNSITFSPARTLDAGEPYFISNSKGARHVSCADCHSSHAARPHPEGIVGSASGSSLQSNDAKNARWSTDQWKGYLLLVRQYTGSTDNGNVQIRYITGFNPTTGTFTVSLPWNSSMFTINNDDHFEVLTGEKWTAAGQEGGLGGTGSSGIWGVKVTGWATPAAGSLQNPATLTYTKVENVYDRTAALGGDAATGQRDLCVKCHGYYSYGTTPPTTTTPGPTPGGTAPTSAGGVLSTDVVAEFNPNNSSHHAVYARGQNQPIRANYGQTGITSYMNTGWPIYATANAGDTVTISSGTATLAGTATLPSTVQPGWWIYVGSDTRTSNNGAAGTASTGYLEITSIASPTSFTVRAENGSGGWVTNITKAAVNTWYVTAGLGNSFVPPYGPWSVLRCTDCHGSTKTDPLGPHASANDWLLKSIDTNLSFEWYNGTSVTVVTPNSSVNTSTQEKNIFCYNCHRRDVYKNNNYTAPPNTGLSRVPHNSNFSCTGLNKEPSNYMPVAWQLWCRHCHGGDKVGGMHGTNKTYRTGSNGITSSTPVKRFLNGATWDSYGKADTSVAGECWTIAGTTNVSSCSQHSSGGKSTGTATYNYW